MRRSEDLYTNFSLVFFADSAANFNFKFSQKLPLEKIRFLTYNRFMVFTILGSGTSHGVPVIACKCKVCTSQDAHDRRLRASALITNEAGGKTTRVLIDVGPDFREQALRAKIHSLDLILLTHGHADHLHGLDDIRIFSHTKVPHSSTKVDDAAKNAPPEGIHIFANAETRKIVRLHFDYIFKRTQVGGGKPRIKLLRGESLTPKNPLEIGGMQIISIPLKHGKVDCLGYLVSTRDGEGKKRSVAYLTDCNFIAQKSIDLILENCGILEHAVIDGLREKTHSTHFVFSQALDVAEKIRPRHTWMTHMTHDKSHEEVKLYLEKILANYPNLTEIVKNGGSVEPAYDGLELTVQ